MNAYLYGAGRLTGVLFVWLFGSLFSDLSPQPIAGARPSSKQTRKNLFIADSERFCTNLGCISSGPAGRKKAAPESRRGF